MTLIIIVAILLALFALAFVTKRRFGVLGLGLAAGSLLAQNLGRWLEDLLVNNQLPVEPLGYGTAAIVLLTLAPSLVLLMSGPAYSSRWPAIAGASSYAILGTLLILGPLTSDLPTLAGGVRDVLLIIAQYQNWIIAGGIVLAVIDLMMAHSTGSNKNKKDKKH